MSHELNSQRSPSIANERRSLDQGASATPTLRDEPLDAPLQEKGKKNPSAEADPDDDDDDDDIEPAPRADTEAVAESAHEGDGDGDDDVLIVDWDGPDDPQNPRNWSFKRKWAATAIVSAFTFILPRLLLHDRPRSDQLAAQFGITNTAIIALTTSIFVLAYAFGPLFLGPLSEIYGRSRVLQLANLWYLAWNLGCGFAQNKGQLIAFRFLAGLGGSAPLSIGGGVLGDCWRPEERGQAVALYSLAPLLGPVIGPVAGAWVAARSTWRWVFWSTTIVDACVQCLGVLFLQETFAPLLLERKAAKMRRELLAGPAKDSPSEKPQPQPPLTHTRSGKPLALTRSGRPRAIREIKTRFEVHNADRTWQHIFAKALVRPFTLFYCEPIVQLLGLYMAFVYGLLYLFLTTIPAIFEGTYGEDVGVAGLNYFALGVGLTGASQVNARLMDKIYVHFARKNGGKGRPEFRLPSMVPGTVCLPIGLFITGWTAQAKTHWIGPDIGIALVGAGTILNFQSIQTYVIDAFTLHAASALAAVTFLRSCAGFGFPLFAPTMYQALGYGKGDTILGCVAVAIGCPAPWVFWRYGARIRKASRHAQA